MMRERIYVCQRRDSNWRESGPDSALVQVHDLILTDRIERERAIHTICGGMWRSAPPSVASFRQNWFSSEAAVARFRMSRANMEHPVAYRMCSTPNRRASG